MAERHTGCAGFSGVGCGLAADRDHRVLNDRQTGKIIRVVNTHFSHIGEEARALAARMLSLQFAMSGADIDVLLGDLNAEPDSRALAILEGGGLSDAYDVAEKRCRKNIGTYTGFPTGGLRGAPRIDHILVRGGSVLWFCAEEQIIDGYYISDHLPVYIALDAMMSKAAMALWGGPVGFCSGPAGAACRRRGQRCRAGRHGVVDAVVVARWCGLDGRYKPAALGAVSHIWRAGAVRSAAARFGSAFHLAMFLGALCWPWRWNDTACTAGLPCSCSEAWAAGHGGPCLGLCSPRRC